MDERGSVEHPQDQSDDDFAEPGSTVDHHRPASWLAHFVSSDCSSRWLRFATEPVRRLVNDLVQFDGQT